MCEKATCTEYHPSSAYWDSTNSVSNVDKNDATAGGKVYSDYYDPSDATSSGGTPTAVGSDTTGYGTSCGDATNANIKTYASGDTQNCYIFCKPGYGS